MVTLRKNEKRGWGRDRERRENGVEGERREI